MGHSTWSIKKVIWVWNCKICVDKLIDGTANCSWRLIKPQVLISVVQPMTEKIFFVALDIGATGAIYIFDQNKIDKTQVF